MSYKNWNMEYRKIIASYKMLIARGYKELLVDSIDALLSCKVNENVDISGQINDLENLRSNIVDSLHDDMAVALKRMN